MPTQCIVVKLSPKAETSVQLRDLTMGKYFVASESVGGARSVYLKCPGSSYVVDLKQPWRYFVEPSTKFFDVVVLKDITIEVE